MPREEVTAPPAREMAVVAVYDDREQAERAIDELRRFDFADDQIGLGGRGAVAGGLLGALAAGAIPGLGPVLAGGLLLGLLEGAAAGGLLGLLVGLGVPEPRARASSTSEAPGVPSGPCQMRPSACGSPPICTPR